YTGAIRFTAPGNVHNHHLELADGEPLAERDGDVGRGARLRVGAGRHEVDLEIRRALPRFDRDVVQAAAPDARSVRREREPPGLEPVQLEVAALVSLHEA